MPQPYVVAFVFAVGFGLLGSYFLSISRAATSTPHTITSGLSGKCLDDKSNVAQKSNPVDIYNCNGSAAQNWQNVWSGSSGQIMFRNGLCVTLAGNSTANGTKVTIYTCGNSNHQQWLQKSNGNLVNIGANKCLTAPSSANGTQLTIQPCATARTNNQIWNHGPTAPHTPAVRITSPAAGATVKGTNVSISATASVTGETITSVTLKVNGATLRTCTNSGSCAAGWNSKSVRDGKYTVQADATASSGGSSTAAESITVKNAVPPNPPPPSPSPSPSPNPSPFSGSGSGSSLHINPNPSPNPSLNNGQSNSSGDNLNFSTEPTDNGGPMVSNVQAISITSNSITLSWESSNANSYDIKYGTNKNQLNNDRAVSSGDAIPTYTLTKLPTNQTIYIQITPSNGTLTGTAVTANFKTSGKSNAGAIFLWIFLTLILVFGIVFFLIRRRLNLEASVDDPDLAAPPPDVPLYPREDSAQESERLNWWMPEEQRHQAAHPQDQPQAQGGDDIPDMYDEGRKRLDKEGHDGEQQRPPGS